MEKINFVPTWYCEESLRWSAIWRERCIKISEDRRMIDGDHYCGMMEKMENDWMSYLWLLSRPLGKHTKYISSINW